MNRSVKVLWDGIGGFSSLSEKTRKSNHLQMSLHREHFLLSYLKIWVLVRPGFKPATFRSADRGSPNWAYQAAVNQSRLKWQSVNELRSQFPDVTGMYWGIMLVPRERHKMKQKTDKTIWSSTPFCSFSLSQQSWSTRIWHAHCLN